MGNTHLIQTCEISGENPAWNSNIGRARVKRGNVLLYISKKFMENRTCRNCIGSIDDGVKLINQFFWYLKIVERGEKWAVYGGEEVLFSADSREAVDAFLYGMALAYSIIPQDYVDRFREESMTPG